MEKFIRFINAENITFAIGVGLIFTGLIALIFPKTSLKTICIIIGALFLVRGAAKLIDNIKSARAGNTSAFSFAYAIFTITVGVKLIRSPRNILSFLPVVLGIAIIAYGISVLINRNTATSKIIGIISIVVGAGIVGAPFKFAAAITAITGIALIILGVIIISKYKPVKDIRKALSPKDDGYKEVEFTDVSDDNT